MIYENQDLGVKIDTNNLTNQLKLEDFKKVYSLSDEEVLEWVQALESKKFKQGRSSLRSGDYFCCLGVKALLEGNLIAENNERNSFAYCGLHTGALMQHERMHDLGLLPILINYKITDEDDYGYWVESKSLAGMNDKGASFEQIAWVIRKIFLEKII